MEEGNGDWIRDRGDSVFTRIQGYYSVQVRKNSWGDNEGEDTGYIIYVLMFLYEFLCYKKRKKRHTKKPNMRKISVATLFLMNFVALSNYDFCGFDICCLMVFVANEVCLLLRMLP